MCIQYKIYSIHNASTSREEMYPHEITKNTEICRNIVIIGGGIAGLECARICKIRGHNVTLYEVNILKYIIY